MSRHAMTGQDTSNRLLVPADFNRNHFNFLRLAMALLVIWSHSYALRLGSEDNEPLSLLLNGTYNAGNIAVRVFFIISGFLITVSFLRSSSLRSYLGKRVARIYPGFLVAVLICAFVIVPLFSTRVDLSASAILRTVTRMFVLRADLPPSDVFAHPPHHGPAVNGSLWSIAFEFWCYLAVAAFGLIGLLRRRVVILLAMLAIMVTRTWLDIHGMKPGGGFIGGIIGWPYLWFSIAPCFLVGMLAYLYRDVLPRSRLLALGLLLGLIASAHISALSCDLLFPPVAAYLTFYVGFSRQRLPDAAHYGDFSYGTYLYGFPIQQMLVEAHLPFIVFIPVAMLLSLGAGVASWFLVERRFLSRKRLRETIHAPAAEEGAGSAAAVEITQA